VKTYFVRKAVDCETVGLFVAPSIVKLAALVDECCDPLLCEYAPAGMGGLMAADATSSKWPRAAGEAATGLENAVFTQQWEDALGSSDIALKWKPLAPAARGLLKALAAEPAQAGPAELAAGDEPAEEAAPVSPGSD
jgi:hypothetical protein